MKYRKRTMNDYKLETEVLNDFYTRQFGFIFPNKFDSPSKIEKYLYYRRESIQIGYLYVIISLIATTLAAHLGDFLFMWLFLGSSVAILCATVIYHLISKNRRYFTEKIETEIELDDEVYTILNNLFGTRNREFPNKLTLSTLHHVVKIHKEFTDTISIVYNENKLN